MWKKNGEDLDIKMSEHGHTYSHQQSPTYQTNGTKWKKFEVKHSYVMNSKRILSKISTLYPKMRIWLKQQNRSKHLYNQQKTKPQNITDWQQNAIIYKPGQFHSQQDYKWKMKIQKGKALDGNQTMPNQQNQFTHRQGRHRPNDCSIRSYYIFIVQIRESTNQWDKRP